MVRVVVGHTGHTVTLVSMAAKFPASCQVFVCVHLPSGGICAVRGLLRGCEALDIY